MEILLAIDLLIRYIACVIFITTLFGVKWTREVRAEKCQRFSVYLEDTETGRKYLPAKREGRSQTFYTKYFR